MIFKNKIAQKIGIDKAVAYTILTRLIQAGSGVISIFFIARFLSSDEQGYYYTFGSILAIQIFFELGLSSIITQYTAHEFAHLSWSPGLVLIGDDYYKSRLSSLLRFCVKWFSIISFLLFFILLVAGFYFFSSYNKGLNIEWQKPWIILSLATALNLLIDPILAYFDGLGEVKDMAKVRLIQKTVNMVLLFTLFACGFKLYAAAIASTVAILINYGQVLFSDRLNMLRVIWKEQKEWRVDYMQEIFPFQYRIAISWISGYFIFQLFSPVLFATEGAVIAGQMGMTMQALNGIAGVSMSWITTKVPALSAYIAKKEYTKLNELFNGTQKSMLAINGALLLILIIGVSVLRYFHISYGGRFLPIVPVMLMALTCFINQAVFAWATYLRCHKQEPFLANSLVIGVLCCLSTVGLGRYFGMQGIVYGYTFITVFLALPWSYLILKQKKIQWHN